MPLPSPLNSPALGFDPTRPSTGPHLLDASLFWDPADSVRRLISARHEALSVVGWRHTVLAPGAYGPGFIDCGGLTVPGLRGRRLPWGRQRLAGLMEAARPDLIEVADPYILAWAALQAGQRLGIPTIAFCHSNLPALAARWAGGRRGLDTRPGWWAARRARAYLVDLYAGFDLVLAPSRAMVRRLQQWGLRQVHHQPLGVDCDTFNPGAADGPMRRRIERHLEVPHGTRLLLYTGRFSVESNLDLLADAVAALGPGHVLVAVGQGPRPPRGRHVRVLPPPADNHRLARLLANCDLYVNASDQDNTGLGALEAMASGLPVVLNAADGLGELAQAGGLSVAGRRLRDWTETLEWALSCDLGAVRAQALNHAREHDWSHILRQVIQRYQWVLQDVRRHRPVAVAATEAGPVSVPPDLTATPVPVPPAGLSPSGLSGPR